MQPVKWILCAALAMTMTNAHALNIGLHERQAEKILLGNEDLRSNWIEKSNSDRFRDRALDAIHNLAHRKPDINVIEAESLMLDIIKTKHHIKDTWAASNNILPNTVWMSHTLIDPERTELGSVRYPKIRSGGTLQHDMRSENRSITGQRTSRTLMRLGMAPIGHDGKPVRLCRLIRHPKASFYEVSDTVSKRLVDASRSGMSPEQACLTYPKASRAYWKGRLNTIYDNQGVKIRH